MYPAVTPSSDNNAHDYAQTASPHYNAHHYHQAPATGVPPAMDYNYNYNYIYPPPNVPPPPPHHHQPHILPYNDDTNKIEWSTGLFDCLDDIPNCLMTWCCPCVTFGQIAEIVDKGSTSCGASGALYALIVCLIGGGCIYSCFYRAKMRRQYMLQESPCWDFLVHCCCESCALCQEYRELNNRGFDMHIGWQANVERRNAAVIPTAPPAVTMNR